MKTEEKEKYNQKKDNERIMVDIEGAVNNPGIVELIPDERIVNVIEKAGGLKENANLRDINLAEKVEDGMKIYIPTNDEILNKKEAENIQNTIDAIEADIFKLEEKEIESSKIGEIVMEKLEDLDPVAYVRFASVYREFKDVNTFMEELKKFLQ